MDDKGNVQQPLVSETAKIVARLATALEQMRQAKPGDRSELDRRYAIAITDLEKVIAYMHTYC